MISALLVLAGGSRAQLAVTGDLLVADAGADAVFVVDVLSGEQRVLASGPPLCDPSGIAVAPTTGLVHVTDRSAGPGGIAALVEIDPGDGSADRTAELLETGLPLAAAPMPVAPPETTYLCVDCESRLHRLAPAGSLDRRRARAMLRHSVSDPARPRLIEFLPEGARLGREEALDRFLSWVERSGLEPYAAQEEALLELATGRHVVLDTPTGSGKSLVALGLHFMALCDGERSFYTAPIKALVSEKFFALCDELGAENVGMLTGDAAINWAAPVICCTAEVLAQMALRQGERCDAPHVVMDEFHYYADRDRGWAWQVPLLTLRRTAFLLMSATLGNTASIEERLADFTGREVANVHSSERPVPLDYEYRETPLVETVETLLAERRAPVYIVHFTQREAAEQAQGLTGAKLSSREERQAVAAAIGDYRFDTPYGKDVRRFLSFGIGVHHAGLLPKYRLLVEQLAQRGLLKVICGTDTLGVGVNIPIRTVLFSRLCKFDGEKVALLRVRDFKQIAGRAGRRGFDERGSVVCQAPEHVIEKRRAESKTGGKRRSAGRKPPRGIVPWSRETFERLVERPPELLESSFRINHGMLLALLQRGADTGEPGSGYCALAGVVRRSHEPERRQRQHLRRSAALFRSLRRAGVVALEPDPERRGARARVSTDLQRDFSLHHGLSLYLVDAVAALDRESDDYALDVISCAEAVLENPRAILEGQRRAAKDELMAQLKAERVPYEERIAKLEEVSWPQPLREFLYATFELFAESHPWVERESLHPKSIAREMFERYAGFDDTVKRYGLQRSEGVLLRYLSQVLNTLSHGVPESARDEALEDAIGYLRALIARVDSSLLEEWESLVHPAPLAESELETHRPRPPRRLDRRALEARLRAELHQLVRALALRDYEEAVACLRAARGEGQDEESERWDAERLEAAMAPFFQEHGELVFDARARRSDLTLVKERDPECFDAFQTLVEPGGETLWSLEAEVRLEGGRLPEGPALCLRRIGT